MQLLEPIGTSQVSLDRTVFLPILARGADPPAHLLIRAALWSYRDVWREGTGCQEGKKT